MQYRANPGGCLKANIAPSEKNASHIQLLCIKDKMKLLGGSSKANNQDLNVINAQKVTFFSEGRMQAEIYTVSMKCFASNENVVRI